jgi:hypothetical protein
MIAGNSRPIFPLLPYPGFLKLKSSDDPLCFSHAACEDISKVAVFEPFVKGDSAGEK